jgi:hypothetical protein
MTSSQTFMPVVIALTFDVDTLGRPCARVVYRDLHDRALCSPSYLYPDAEGTIILEHVGLALAAPVLTDTRGPRS